MFAASWLLQAGGGIGVAIVALFPAAFQWILGSAYSGLHEELILMAVASAFSLIGDILGKSVLFPWSDTKSCRCDTLWSASTDGLYRFE